MQGQTRQRDAGPRVRPLAQRVSELQSHLGVGVVDQFQECQAQERRGTQEVFGQPNRVPADTGVLVGQGVPHDAGLELAEAVEHAQGVQADFRPGTGRRHFL